MANRGRVIEHEFDKYDIDFLVNQYEILLQVYSSEGSLGTARMVKLQKIF